MAVCCAGLSLAEGGLDCFKGGLGFFNKVCGLPSWKANNICWWCTVHRDHLTDLEAGQPLTSDDFFKRCSELGEEVAPLFGAPGVSTSTISVDWMHCVELGIAQDMLGNVLWHCIHEAGVVPGGSQQARLDSLSEQLLSWNHRSKPSNPIQVLTIKMVKGQGCAPKLKSKAAECRGIQGFAKELALKIFQAHPCEFNAKILEGIDALLACSASVVAESWSLQEFQRTGRLFLEACFWLRAHSEDDLLWALKPKHHMFKHVVFDVAPRLGSPALCWCWADESHGWQIFQGLCEEGR